MTRSYLQGSLIVMLLFSGSVFAQEHTEKGYETAMTKGTFALDTGDHAAAVEQFRQALTIKPGDKGATLFLGIAYSRAGNLAKADETLRAVQSMDPSDLRAQYELGVVRYKQGDTAGARALFSAVAEGSAEDDLKVAAKAMLDRRAADEGSKRFFFDVQAGYQYDSNVILGPDNAIAPPPSRQSDSSGVLTLDAAYQFLKGKTFGAKAGYRFYQSLHFELEDFNIQQHTLDLDGYVDITATTRARLKYDYIYSMVGGDHYSTYNVIQPVLEVKFSADSLTAFHFGYGTKRFTNSIDFPLNSTRDANNASGGITHTFKPTKRTEIALDYTYDQDSADVSVWDSTGNSGSASIWTPVGPLMAFASAAYTDRKYGTAAGSTMERHDEIQTYSLGLTKELSKTFRLTASDTYIINDSNLGVYQYNRNIIGFFAELRL